MWRRGNAWTDNHRELLSAFCCRIHKIILLHCCLGMSWTARLFRREGDDKHEDRQRNNLVGISHRKEWAERLEIPLNDEIKFSLPCNTIFRFKINLIRVFWCCIDNTYMKYYFLLMFLSPLHFYDAIWSSISDISMDSRNFLPIKNLTCRQLDWNISLNICELWISKYR